VAGGSPAKAAGWWTGVGEADRQRLWHKLPSRQKLSNSYLREGLGIDARELRDLKSDLLVG